MELGLDRARNLTGIQAHRDDEDLVERNLAGAIERVSDLRLEAAALAHGVGTEAGDEKIGRVDGGLNPRKYGDVEKIGTGFAVDPS